MIFSKKNPIPPRSLVKIAKSDARTPCWADEIGMIYRIGYYSKQDGLDVVWLVGGTGKYAQTTDQDSFKKYFDVMEVSDETDLFGVNRKVLGSYSPPKAKK